MVQTRTHINCSYPVSRLYLGIGEADTRAVYGNPGTPFYPQHQGTHREDHSQHVPEENREIW